MVGSVIFAVTMRVMLSDGLGFCRVVGAAFRLICTALVLVIGIFVHKLVLKLGTVDVHVGFILDAFESFLTVGPLANQTSRAAPPHAISVLVIWPLP